MKKLGVEEGGGSLLQCSRGLVSEHGKLFVDERLARVGAAGNFQNLCRISIRGR